MSSPGKSRSSKSIDYSQYAGSEHRQPPATTAASRWPYAVVLADFPGVSIARRPGFHLDSSRQRRAVGISGDAGPEAGTGKTAAGAEYFLSALSCAATFSGDLVPRGAKPSTDLLRS